MAYNLLSSDSTSQWLANTAGDTYVVKEGVYLGVAGTAIQGNGAFTNRKFQIDGHVIGEGGGSGMFIGQDADNGGSSTIHISQTGSVFGEAYGIVSYGGDLHFLNQGSLTGSTAGLYMAGAQNAVINDGAIIAFGGAGINSLGIDALIKNDGVISGVTGGVLLAGAGSTLINNGDISSNDDAFSTTAVHMTGGNSDFINYGTISTLGGRVLLGDDGGQAVANMGTIEGYVALGGGFDYFNNHGGTVFGVVDLGAGDDIFSSENGTVTGSITGGADNDAYYMYDTTTEISEELNSGEDTVYAFVSYLLAENFENLVLKGNANLNAYGNASANAFEGNDGNNKLFGGAGMDRFEVGLGNDLHNGGAGVDTMVFSNNAESAVTINLATGKGGGAAAGQTFVSIENVEGSEFKDQITGNSAANRLWGNLGNDSLTGGGGKDAFVFTGFDDKDTITDFKDKVDKIVLDVHIAGFDANDFSDLGGLISQNGNDVVINFTSVNAGDLLRIRNANIDDFSAADFQFL